MAQYSYYPNIGVWGHDYENDTSISWDTLDGRYTPKAINSGWNPLIDSSKECYVPYMDSNLTYDIVISNPSDAAGGTYSICRK